MDVLTAKDASIGILAALRAHDRTGQDQRVEVNLLSSLLASMASQAGSYLVTGIPPNQVGNRHPSIAPLRDPALMIGAAGRCLRQRRPVPTAHRGAGHPRRRAGLPVRQQPRPGRASHRLRTGPRAATGAPRCQGVGAAHRRSRGISRYGRHRRVSLLTRHRAGVRTPGRDMPAPHPQQTARPIVYSSARTRRSTPPPDLGRHKRGGAHLGWMLMHRCRSRTTP